ncbi:MAG: glycoside hydrolase domain-containing protein [Lentisphaeria bacterium]
MLHFKSMASGLLLLTAGVWADDDGVLFYAGFDGTATAVARGDGTAQGHEGGPRFQPGKRGQALLSGDGDGYVSYAVARNLLADRGTIEFWVSPQDWFGADEMFHLFFEAAEPGWLMIYKHLVPGNGFFLLSGDHKVLTTASQDISAWRPGEWHHLAVTWEPREMVFYLDGKPSGQGRRPSIPAGLAGRFLIGDRPWTSVRQARSRLDELYIYDRPLSAKEVAWAYQQAMVRPVGKDVPEGLTPVRMEIKPFPSQGKIAVELTAPSRRREECYRGTVRLEPAAGTTPVAVAVSGGKSEQAIIPFKELPRGDYRVEARLTGEQGTELAPVVETLMSPGPTVWRGNGIGIPKTPPPPWTPLNVTQSPGGSVTIACWGRSYEIGAGGFPSQITSANAALLAAPINLQMSVAGKPVRWHATAMSVEEHNPVQVRLKGSAVSEGGTLQWICTAEFDGTLRYDMTLQPVPGVRADTMALRIPVRPSRSTLHYLFLDIEHTRRGATPAGQGVVYKANWAAEWWLGDEDRGLAGFCESDEAWDRVNRDDGFRLERTPQSVDAVWSFNNQPRQLDKPWTFTFGLQATPVKDITGWRKWRLTTESITGNAGANLNILWALPEYMPYFGYPQAKDSKTYAALVNEYHAKGIKVIPYSNIMGISSQAPEWSWYREEWRNGAVDSSSQDVLSFQKAPFMGSSPASVWMGCSPSPAWIDFMVWANARYVRGMDLDGLYHDYTGAVYPSNNSLSGCGYWRDGQLRPTYPIFATRELYKRIYTMLKEYGREKGKEMHMMGHMSSFMIIPVVGFCDSALGGENLRFISPPLKDNYLDVVSLDQLRAEFMGRNWGVMPFLLPEFTGDNVNKPEPTQHLMGLALLHDFAIWPNKWYCNNGETERIFRALDAFGLVDAQLLPYWNNHEIVGGQTDQVKASVYRKPQGGSLLCVVNLTRQRQSAALSVDWNGLKSAEKLTVVDALSKTPITINGKSVVVDLAPLNFRLLWVK